MRHIIASLFGLIFIVQNLAAAPAPSDPQSQPGGAAADEDTETRTFLKKIDWKRGPSEADVGSYAKIKVPEGYIFTAGAGTRKLLEAMGNPTNGDELGFLAPTNMQW